MCVVCLTLSVPRRRAVDGSSWTREISSIRRVRQQSRLYLEDFGAVRHCELTALNRSLSPMLLGFNAAAYSLHHDR